MKRIALLFSAVLFLASAPGCGDVGDDHGHHHHEHEVFTTVTLTFTPATGDPIVATWKDPENDGSPVIDPINLVNGETYEVAVTFFNELELPVEEVTPEIRDEDDEHQVFFFGTAVSGPSSDTADAPLEQAYDDADDNGFPIGLANTFSAVAAGSGTMTVVLRHMPTVNGETVKTAALADDVKSGGVTALPGATDITVDFDVTVE